MRLLVAPDCFAGTLSALEAARAIEAGWARFAPGDSIELCPLADGGPGFLDAVQAALGGTVHERPVSGPLGRLVPARALLIDRPGGPPTAYLESADACGLHLVPEQDRDPRRTTTRGVGELILAARELGAGRIVVGLGGSSTNDAGAGMLAALGVGLPPGGGSLGQGGGGLGQGDGPLGEGGGGLGSVTALDLAGLLSVRRGLAGLDLVAAVDVDVPLLGLHGASAGFAPQKGATQEQAQELERALGHFAALAESALGGGSARANLLVASEQDPDRRTAALPGAGAAGGLGFGLALLGARLVPGAAVVADAVGLAERLARNDLVVTGEGTFDWQSLHGKAVAEVARLAGRAGVPAIVLAGQSTVGRREWSANGISGVYPVADRPAEVRAALADPAGTLAARAARVARTWSR